VKVLLTQEKLKGRFAGYEGAVVYLDQIEPLRAEKKKENLSLGVSEKNLAYVLYTSGSSGKPKGVSVEHRQIINYLYAVRDRLGLAGGKGYAFISTFAADLGNTMIYPCLCSGGCLHVISEEAAIDPKKLSEYFVANKVDYLKITPSHLLALQSGLHSLAILPRERLILGGEASSYAWVEKLVEMAPDCSVFNHYGPTETTVGVLTWEATRSQMSGRVGHLPLGRPLGNTDVYILDELGRAVPIGVRGELYIGGEGVTRGYLGRPDLTAEKFLPNPFSDCVGSRLYRSGDSARYLADGNIEFLGRIDQQMKLRGYRVELEEIESVLGGAGGVKRAAVVVREDELGPKKLVGYIVMEEGCVTTIGELRSYLQRKLPEHMVPDAFVILESLPLTANGKIDRKALPAPQRRQAEAKYIAPRNTLEKLIAGVWRELLNMEEVGIHDNFFELGGHSLLLARVHGRLEQLLQREFAMVELFQYPTISRLAEHLTGAVGPFLQGIWGRAERQQSKVKDAVAIIGLVGRFPGARNIEEFWRNLQGGVESISFFTDDELMAAGIDSQVLHNPNYVKAQGVMEDADLFDAEFFGYSPGEAELIDPQQRIFLECAWEALEQAGYHAESYGCAIGVYAGMSRSSYILNLLSNRELMSSMGVFQVTISNDKDFLSTRVSYKLNLKGPSVGVQTSCSTSLVAVQMACESLLAGKCDMALAGGVSVGSDQLGGYYYQSEGIVSPDGHCRVFDARAQGMVRGNGVGIVVLKRLSEALAEGDTIHAVIKGSAINNDGSMKVGYTAPSVNGQAEVIALAQALGGVEARSISYVEAHGTGTALGDPIEIAALTQAFGASTKEKGFCAIGAVKSNIGHLDVAAGVAGLIKTVLALKHQKIPASLHYEQPNPKIDFANSPFYVNARLSEWKNDKMPRRAGVSSFGIGGTNAHVVVEEAPELQPSGMSRPHQLWVLSARSESALEQATKNLLKHLTAEPEINLADAAYTLQVGRKKLGKRRVVVGAGREQTIEGLTTLQGVINGETAGEEKAVVFLFSGQGAQYEKMGWGLYQQEIVFREEVDRCSERLKEDLGVDLRAVMYPGEQWGDGQDSLKQTWLAQPALFVLGYALAKLWKSWGIEPQGMIGHSIGEYIAACLAGVFTVEEGLKLVALRGRLMQAVPPGTMISVGFSEVEAQTFLQEAGAERCVSVAAVNGPKLSVLSGPAEAVEKLKVALTAAGVAYQLIETSHAFHSGMLDGVVDRFVEEVRKVKLRPPTLPYLSNVTGKWITKEEAIDPEYWGRHLRQTVRFSEGLQELLKGGEKVLLEVGPGRMLSSLAKMHFGDEPGHVALSTLRHRDGQQEDQVCLLESLGRLWLLGVNVKWDGFYAGERRRRIPLPTYPFERKRYYVEPQRRAKETPERSLHKNQRVGDWFYAPSWKRNELFQPQSDQKLRERRRSWLLFLDEEGVGLKLAQALEVTGQVVTIVKIGTGFGSKSPHEFTLNPGTPEHYLTLLKELCLAERKPDVIVHLWCVTGKAEEASGSDAFERSQALGFYSLLFLAQAIGEQLPGDTLQLTVVSTHVQKVTGDEKLSPEKATVLGPCRVIPQEYANIQCTSVDIALPGGGAPSEEYEHGLLLEEITQENPDVVVAHRGGYRWVQTFESMTLQPTVEGWAPRENGVYIITGGLGGIGLVLAEHLAKAAKVKLVLIGRTIFPERNQWQQWLDTHGEANRTSSKIRKIQALERFGTEVCVVNADITDRTRMQAVAKDIADRFGTVHGIIHAAGVAGGGIIQLRTREAAAKVLAPKVEGTLILGELFRDVKLDFFVLCSSLNSFLGGIGGADYCAANAFLDAYAQQRGPATRVVAVNWDVWQEVGMAVNTEVPAAFKDAREKHLQSGILPAEGQEVFSRVLESRLVQVAIATRDLVGQIAEWRARKLRAEKEPVLTATDGNRPAFDRPHLSSIYIPPGNPTEQTIAEIWQKLLAIKSVGIHDNFFELGGHSLLLIQMLPFLKKAFAREFTVAMLFQRATIHSLSTAILEGNSQPVYQKSRSRGERRKEKRAQMAVHSKVNTKQ
jgi:amino acid adenylation domain-containing protein